jgi:polyphosphate kinase 2 (PPK2 family)
MTKSKSKAEQDRDDVDLAPIWPDPPVESLGTTARTIPGTVYREELARLQVELVKCQEWVKARGLKVVILFEGCDAAGKGGAIKTFTLSLNPRYARVAALPAPTERERSQWYFQRYVAHLPAAGEMVLFDRSWYNRAGVERVMGFCTAEEYEEFGRSCPEFERMLVRSGVMFIKAAYLLGRRSPSRVSSNHGALAGSARSSRMRSMAVR